MSLGGLDDAAAASDVPSWGVATTTPRVPSAGSAELAALVLLAGADGVAFRADLAAASLSLLPPAGVEVPLDPPIPVAEAALPLLWPPVAEVEEIPLGPLVVGVAGFAAVSLAAEPRGRGVGLWSSVSVPEHITIRRLLQEHLTACYFEKKLVFKVQV